jgi:hypothetical protein
MRGLNGSCCRKASVSQSVARGEKGVIALFCNNRSPAGAIEHQRWISGGLGGAKSRGVRGRSLVLIIEFLARHSWQPTPAAGPCTR